MDYSTILSDANHLRTKSKIKIYINDVVRELLHRINSAIMDAHNIGISKIEYKLPINFNTLDENISNEETQTTIYYKIVQELEKKKYTISIDMLKDYTILYIEWTSKVNNDELQNMKDKLFALTNNTKKHQRKK